MQIKSFLKADPVIFFACKHSSDTAVRGVLQIIKWLNKSIPKAKIIGGPGLFSRIKSHSILNNCDSISFVSEESESQLKDADLIISCGGDGTLLHISSIFQSEKCPPVLPFSLGSLGFLSTFDFSEYKLVLSRLFRDKLTFFNRSRLQIDGPSEIGSRVILNEILLSRGNAKDVPEFEFCVGDDNLFFPPTIADGIILATSTGSTGHSLSANGPIQHPYLDSVILNMLSPRSLSFRPLILPTCEPIKIGLSPTSRASSAEIHLDGRIIGNLDREDLITVTKAKHPITVFNFLGASSDWNNRLSTTLKWSQSFRDTSFIRNLN